MKGKKRKFGWLYTINSLDEKSFPFFIKNISMKQLLVIFPLALLTIYLVQRNIMYTFVTLGPIMFILFYDEKSLGPFEYVYYFLISLFITTSAPQKRTQQKKIATPRIMLPRFTMKKIDIIQLGAGSILMIISIVLLRQQFSLANLLISVFLGSISVAFLASEILIFNEKRRKKEKQS